MFKVGDEISLDYDFGSIPAGTQAIVTGVFDDGDVLSVNIKTGAGNDLFVYDNEVTEVA